MKTFDNYLEMAQNAKESIIKMIEMILKIDKKQIQNKLNSLIYEIQKLQLSELEEVRDFVMDHFPFEIPNNIADKEKLYDLVLNYISHITDTNTEDEYAQIREVLKNAKSSGPEFGLFDRYKE